MNKFSRIASDYTVKSLISAIIEHGEIGEYAYPLRDAVLETGELKECRDSLLVLLVAHEVYDRDDGNLDGDSGSIAFNKRFERITESPRLISVFDFDHCRTRMVGGEWCYSGLFWQKGTRYTRECSLNTTRDGVFVVRYSAQSILRELRRTTPMEPIPVE